MTFQDYQRAFTGRIRDPKARLPAKVAAADMRVYQQLLYNNIETFLLACFPVCRKILGSRRWARMVRTFFRDHACHTPYFRQIPEEFLAWLSNNPSSDLDLPAFLAELAHYEWVELALDTSAADQDLPAYDPVGDLLTGRPLLNPVLQVLAYQWPVQHLSPRFKPVESPAQPTFLLAFRDADLRVRFSLINATTARLLSLLQERGGLSGREALALLAAELKQPSDNLVAFGGDLLADLRRQGAILGTVGRQASTR